MTSPGYAATHLHVEGRHVPDGEAVPRVDIRQPDTAPYDPGQRRHVRDLLDAGQEAAHLVQIFLNVYQIFFSGIPNLSRPTRVAKLLQHQFFEVAVNVEYSLHLNSGVFVMIGNKEINIM